MPWIELEEIPYPIKKELPRARGVAYSRWIDVAGDPRESEFEPETVTVLVSGNAKTWVMNNRLHPSQTVEVSETSCRVRFRVHNWTDAVRFCLRWGSQAYPAPDSPADFVKAWKLEVMTLQELTARVPEGDEPSIPESS